MALATVQGMDDIVSLLVVESTSMDRDHLDTLARCCASAGSRRSLLGLLAAVPVIGGLAGSRSPEETVAKERRRRRKQRHKRRKDPGDGKRGKHKKRCQPRSVAETCAGQCGSVSNTCQQTVECGSCACSPACGVCFTCQEGPGPNAPGSCVVDPAQQGETCGEPGQVCQPDGRCRCNDTSCAACETCLADGHCSAPCAGSGCCDGAGACQAGDTLAACGRGGEACIACAGDTVCRADGQGETCRVNQPPTALARSVTGEWMRACVLLALSGTDPDGDALGFEVLESPASGQIYVYADDAPNLLGPPVPIGGTPLPAEPGTGDLRLCYRPFSRFFSGSDGFPYRAVDQHGAVSAEARVNITIVEA